ncbi:MAG TPA: ketopantoate reductase family protein [Pseudonocardia sp.]|jgi:2-dehydropantoate 2-reductase|nr:ketopantoate reductase family protein [Pseudonocardia sp.]
MRILVVGAGATGGYFGGRLTEAGRDVTFLVRPGRAAVLRKRGLRIRGLGKETVLEPKLVLAHEVTAPYDVVVLTVKEAGLESAIADLAPAVGPDTLILPVLNGLRHIDVLVARFGERAVLGGLVFVASMLASNGDVVQLGPLGSMVYGARDGQPDPRLDELHRTLSGAGFDTELSADINTAMWAKWVFIASICTVTCLMRGAIGEVEAVPGGAAFAEAVVAEAASVAAAAGYPVPAEDLERARATVTKPGSPFASSLYRDLDGGNDIEVEQILGDLQARGEALGVPVPLISLVTMQLRVYQNRLRREEQEDGED